MPFTKAPIKHEKLNSAGLSWMSETLGEMFLSSRFVRVVCSFQILQLQCYWHVIMLSYLHKSLSWCHCSTADPTERYFPYHVRNAFGPREKPEYECSNFFCLLMSKTLSWFIIPLHKQLQHLFPLVAPSLSFGSALFSYRRQPGFDNTACASLGLCSCVKLGEKKLWSTW